MSGVCGIIHFDDRPADHAGLQAMIDAARHRAHDGTAIWTGDGCTMAQLVSCHGPVATPSCEPRLSSDGRFVIVGDVHLHDSETLRSSLAIRGADAGDARRCPACSATDLVLRAFLHWGTACLEHLIGDYAFAIWDRAERRLFAARDPMGLRPLYYHSTGRHLIFASEIGQLLASGRAPRRLDRSMAVAWLTVNAGDPARTFFQGIAQLPGAHGLAVDEHGARASRLWSIDPGRRIVYRSESEYVDHLRHLLLTATRARLAGGRPAGMLLSGGLDSCAVAGAVGWLLHHEPSLAGERPFTTFSYRFEGFPACDERHVSEPLAKHWGMQIEEISSDSWRASDLIERPWEIDSPAIGIYRPLQDAALDRARSLGLRQLFRAARGDNMVGGYVWDHLGLLSSGSVAETWRELQRYRSAYGTSLAKAVRKTLYDPIAFAVTARVRPLATPGERRRARSLAARREAGRLADPWVPANLLQEIDLPTVFGPRDRAGFTSWAAHARHGVVFDPFTELGNTQVERRTAEFGLHDEDPWSDRRILEFVCAVPQHVLNRIDDTKRLARRALEGLVPSQVQASARKIIPAPFGLHALRTREAASLSALTTGMRAAQAGLVDEASLAAHVGAFLQGADLASGAWSAVALEAWLRSNDIEA